MKKLYRYLLLIGVVALYTIPATFKVDAQTVSIDKMLERKDDKTRYYVKNYEIIDSPKRNSKVTKKQGREDKLTQYLLLEVTIDNPKKSYIFFDDVIQVSSGGNIVPSVNNTVLNYEKIPALEKHGIKKAEFDGKKRKIENVYMYPIKKYNETKIMLKDKNSWTSLQVTTPEPAKNGITAQAYPLEVGERNDESDN